MGPPSLGAAVARPGGRMFCQVMWKSSCVRKRAEREMNNHLRQASHLSACGERSTTQIHSMAGQAMERDLFQKWRQQEGDQKQQQRRWQQMGSYDVVRIHIHGHQCARAQDYRYHNYYHYNVLFPLRTERPNKSSDMFNHSKAAFSSQGGGGFLLEETQYHQLSDDSLQTLYEHVDALGEELDVEAFEADYSQGVLTINLGTHGIFVINKQTPNRQIWLSSPISGPARFDWREGQWVYSHTGDELFSLLKRELSQLLGHTVCLTH